MAGLRGYNFLRHHWCPVSNCELRSDSLKTRISAAILTVKFSSEPKIIVCIVFSVFESRKFDSLQKKKNSSHMPFKRAEIASRLYEQFEPGISLVRAIFIVNPG